MERHATSEGVDSQAPDTEGVPPAYRQNPPLHPVDGVLQKLAAEPTQQSASVTQGYVPPPQLQAHALEELP